MIIDIKEEGISHATENIIVCDYLNHMYDKYLTNVIDKLSNNFVDRLIDKTPSLERTRNISMACIQQQFRCIEKNGFASIPSDKHWHIYNVPDIYTLFTRYIPLTLFDIDVQSVQVWLTMLIGSGPNDNKILLEELFSRIGNMRRDPVAIPVGLLGAKNEKLQTLESSWIPIKNQIDKISSKYGVEVVLYLCKKNGDDIWSDYEEPGC